MTPASRRNRNFQLWHAIVCWFLTCAMLLTLAGLIWISSASTGQVLRVLTTPH